MSRMENTELPPSELGTQAYWQQTYAKEIKNFDDHGDPGDVWFGEDSAQRVISWICDCGVDKNIKIIDLGCGNGYSLMELAKEGFTNLLGVDYCEEAIKLAEKVSKIDHCHIKYQVFNITEDNAMELGKFGIIHDKGTYDAIGLNPADPKSQREKYIDQVVTLLDDNVSDRSFGFGHHRPKIHLRRDLRLRPNSGPKPKVREQSELNELLRKSA